MAISIKEAQKLGLLPKSEPMTKQSKQYVHLLTRRLTPICSQYGWFVDVYRAFSMSPESPRNEAVTTAKPNAVIVWRETERVRVVHLGWLWDVQEWTDEQVVARLREIEVQGCSA